MSRLFASLLALSALASLGCSPRIGNQCNTYLDCDVQGVRFCDTGSPFGYCTVRDCDPGSCPLNESICVQFLQTPQRLARTFCMATCQNDSNCRTSQGYHCVSSTDPLLAARGARVNEVSGTDRKFCAHTEIVGDAAVLSGGDGG